MHPADIKAAIKKSGSTQVDIANTMQVSAVTVHQVIKGTCHSTRIAKYISELTGLSLDELWPDKYSTEAA